jgi:hypothetical protein
VRRARLSALTATGARASAPAHCCPNSDATPAHATAGPQSAGTRSGHRPSVGARPHAVPAPCGTPMVGPPPHPPFLLPFSPPGLRSRRAHLLPFSARATVSPCFSTPVSCPVHQQDCSMGPTHRDLGPSLEFGPPPPLSASRVGKPCLVEFFLKFEPGSPSHFPLEAVGLPPAPSKSQEHPHRREALSRRPSSSRPTVTRAHPVSVRPHGCARCLPLLLLELTPLVPPHLVPRLDAGGHATTSVPCAVTARRARPARRAGMGWLGHRGRGSRARCRFGPVS